MKIGLFLFFLLCAIYTHYLLPMYQNRIYNSTIKQHEKSALSPKIKEFIATFFSKNERYLELQEEYELLKLNEWSANYVEEFELKVESNYTEVGGITEKGHWRDNVLNALGLLVLSERTCSDGKNLHCIKYTSKLIRVEAHVQDLLNGVLPKYVYNEYNVYKTVQLLDSKNYLYFVKALAKDNLNIRDSFLGLQYLKLSQAYQMISDYPRARRNFELAIELLGWDFLADYTGSDRLILNILYPRPHWAYVENLSLSNDFDVNLLYGIMRVESSYDAKKISSAGACGLMQIMPQTAESLSVNLTDLERGFFNLDGQRDNLKWNCEVLENPLLNIRLSTIFLNQLQQKYQIFNVIAASYNAGETVVKHWMKKISNTQDSFYKQVRYSETRRYIQKVLLAWTQYRSVYNGSGFTAQNVRYVN